MRKKTAKVISMIITLAVMMTVMTVAIPLTASEQIQRIMLMPPAETIQTTEQAQAQRGRH